MRSGTWLPVSRIARIRASSEAPQFPAAHAFSDDPDAEWRAGQSGAQTIVVRFRLARTIRRIRVEIVDAEQERTQEFTVAWTSRRGERTGVAVRQQFNFSPHGATREVEEYDVNLPAISTLELRILPDISGGSAIARVKEFALG